MRLFGDNSKYGKEPVELESKRTVGEVITDGEAFPAGVAGLIPVISKRKKGGTKTVYAFPTAEGDTGELEQTDELAVITDGVELVNRLLAQAAELAHIELGQIFGVAMGITEEGYGFTRVEVVTIDEHNRPSETPVHLHIETSDTPGEPGTVNAVIALDAEGVPARVLVTEFNERGATIRINVNVNEKTDKLSVQKVEDIRGGESRLLYKRGWTPKGAEYVYARRDGRDGGERGGRFVRETGRTTQHAPRNERPTRDDDRRSNGQRDSRPARRDEVPGMRRIDGSAAKRGGTFPQRDRDERPERRGGSDERRGGFGGRSEQGGSRGGQGDRDFRGPRDDRRSGDSRDSRGGAGQRDARGSRPSGFSRDDRRGSDSHGAGRTGGRSYKGDSRSEQGGSRGGQGGGRSFGSRPGNGGPRGNGGRPSGGNRRSY